MHRNKSVSVHDQTMVPRSDVPRSGFRIQSSLKTTFDAGWLIPIYVDEMLPGDRFAMTMTAFARLATPLFPVMDNLHFETFFFAVPMRLVWDHTEEFFGQQTNPDDPTDYIIPQLLTPADGYPLLSIYDYFGLPTEGMAMTTPLSHNVLPLRAYNLIYNEFFRDENLQDSISVPTGDGPDTTTFYALRRRGKRKDYFTGCLPFPQKGPSVPLPLTGEAPIFGRGDAGYPMAIGVQEAFVSGGTPNVLQVVNGNAGVNLGTPAAHSASLTFTSNEQPLFADLSTVVAATVNELRLAFQTQKLFERDARGGTRYVEMVKAAFGVTVPDFRVQRPEYLGGGHSPVAINPIAQTSATSADGTDTPQGNLAAMGTALARHGFVYSAVEHCYIIGLCNVRADLNYQQGINKLWNRETRFDFYDPVFQSLGEQAVLRKEIYVTGDDGLDNTVFGYQERWAEYRYKPSMITGLFRSTAAQTIDPWHYAQEFATPPVLDEAFIVDMTDTVVERSTAVHAEAAGQQFLLDAFFDNKAARPLPLYSVPGNIDRF